VKGNLEDTFTFKNALQAHEMRSDANFEVWSGTALKRKRQNETKFKELPILVLSHCILNRATRWWQRGKPLDDNRGMTVQILDLLAHLKIGVVQLPCPEFTFCGNPRPPRTKNEYLSLPGFREHCARLADEAANYLKNLIDNAREPPLRILAIVGVERSPTCGVKCTPTGRGMNKRYEEKKGFFIELLAKSLRKRGLKVPIIGVDLDRPEEFSETLNKLTGYF